MRKILLFCVVVLALNSCHIEKRRYLPGYSISSGWGLGKVKGGGKKDSVQKDEACLISQDSIIQGVQSCSLDSLEREETIKLSSTKMNLADEQPKEKLGEQSKRQKKFSNLKSNWSLSNKDSYSSNNAYSLREKSAISAYLERVQDSTDLVLLLLIVLAIILPPLAVLIETGLSKVFWIDLLLAIFSGTIIFGIGLPIFQGLAGICAILLALMVVLQRNNVLSEAKIKQDKIIPWTAWIFPPFVLRWLDGVKGWEIALAIFLTIFGYYLGMLFVNYLIHKYPEKVLTEEQKRIMKMNNIGILFAVLGSIASLIYLSLYTNIFNGI